MIRERGFTWSDPNLSADGGRAMAGLNLMRRLRDCTAPPPPITNLVGIAPTEVDAGRVAKGRLCATARTTCLVFDLPTP